jgi:hypothetical protein
VPQTNKKAHTGDTVRIIAAGWTAIEQAYGQAIPEEARAEIEHHTNQYLEFAAFEKAAAPLRDVVSRIDEISKPAWALLVALEGDKDGQIRPHQPTEAETEAKIGIGKHLRLLHAGAPSLADISQAIYDLVQACRDAKAVMEGRVPLVVVEGATDFGPYCRWPAIWAATFRYKEHWELWVRRIQATLMEHGLDAGTGKNFKANNNKPLPLQRLIRVLQLCIPSEYRHHENSESALAKALLEATRESTAST